jgi:hypothetical protein
MNEADAHSGRAILKKTWAERLQEKPELESDADEQLLMQIPCVDRDWKNYYALPCLNRANVLSTASPVRSSSTQ